MVARLEARATRHYFDSAFQSQACLLYTSVLRFHRSWTGIWIYALRLEAAGDQWRAHDAWVNREADQYGCTDLDTDRKLLARLVDGLLAAPRE